MPIRFRCTHCQSLMAISRRRAGTVVNCLTCGQETLVPTQADPPAEADVSEAPVTQPAEPSVELPPLPPPIPPRIIPSSKIEQEQPAVTNLRPDVETQPDAGADTDEGPFVPCDPDSDDDDSEGPMTFRRHRGSDDDMDLTPMVDVTFQLLIFFMVSASFSLQKSIEVPIPDPDQKGAAQQVRTMDDLQGTSIIVRIDANNSLWIDDEPLADINRLGDTLRDKMRREQKTEMLVAAHTQSLHRSVIAVIDAANEVGIQKIRMSSHKKSD